MAHLWGVNDNCFHTCLFHQTYSLKCKMLIAREGSLNNYKQPPDATESEPVSSFRIGAVKGEEMDSHTHPHMDPGDPAF